MEVNWLLFNLTIMSGCAGGICFFVADADRWDGKTLGPGGALGYSFCHDHNPGPGLAYGYFAIGFDSYGSFSNYANCIALRGPGYDYKGYKIITRKSFAVSGPEWRKVKIMLCMQKKKYVSVEVSCDQGETYEKVFDQVNLHDPEWGAPEVYMMGFVASTGSYSNKHYVRNMSVTSRSLTGVDRPLFASDISIITLNA
jgi:hypothetical protein